MNINQIFLAPLLIMAPLCAKALDLDLLEEAVLTEQYSREGRSFECDDSLALRIGTDLPSDADSCHSTEQYELLKQGLYRTTKGSVKSLDRKKNQLESQEEIIIPNLKVQQARDGSSSYVIDLKLTESVATDK